MTQRLWSELAKNAKPYVPGEQPAIDNLIKLNTNENPYPPSPRVTDALRRFDFGNIRLYPDPESAQLKAALAARHGLEPENVFVGNGSDEVLALCFPAFFNRGAEVAFADITYSFYEVYAELFGVEKKLIPLTADFTLDAAAYAGRGAAIIANPNAPTSIRESLETIAEIADGVSGVLIVDEAYAEFGAMSSISLLTAHQNILVVKTFSKSHSLAGMRVGYALGSKHLIEALTRIKNCFNSYPLDKLAQTAAVAAINDEDYVRERIADIVSTRAYTQQELIKLGFEILEPSANFLFAKHKRIKGVEIFNHLRERGILVRRFERPRIADYLRITIGTDEQMAAMIRELRAFIQ